MSHSINTGDVVILNPFDGVNMDAPPPTAVLCLWRRSYPTDHLRRVEVVEVMDASGTRAQYALDGVDLVINRNQPNQRVVRPIPPFTVVLSDSQRDLAEAVFAHAKKHISDAKKKYLAAARHVEAVMALPENIKTLKARAKVEVMMAAWKDVAEDPATDAHMRAVFEKLVSDQDRRAEANGVQHGS